MSDNIEWQADRQQRAFDWFAVADVDATQALADAHGDATWESRRSAVEAGSPASAFRGEPGFGRSAEEVVERFLAEPRWSQMFVHKTEPSRSGDF